jgi:hypothetical protein
MAVSNSGRCSFLEIYKDGNDSDPAENPGLEGFPLVRISDLFRQTLLQISADPSQVVAMTAPLSVSVGETSDASVLTKIIFVE